MDKKTLIVNLFGAPGSGKSTGSAYIFSKLKMNNVDCELVTEFAKDKVWEESTEVFKCQPYIFAKQLFRQSRVKGKVDVIVTDSPLLLSIFYNSNKNPDIVKHFNDLVLAYHKQEYNLNIFINRAKPYNPNGRLHSEDESKQIADRIKQEILIDNDIMFTEINGIEEEYDIVVEAILSLLMKENRK